MDLVIYPLVLVCLNNNKAITLLDHFRSAVNKFGLPSRVRSDKGLENVLIADFMIGKRGTGVTVSAFPNSELSLLIICAHAKTADR